MTTCRTFGEWPDWKVEAGWTDHENGYFYCMVSKFDGNHETCYDLDYILDRKSITPKKIEKWLEENNDLFNLKPPKSFFDDLAGDRGKNGFHVTQEY